MTLHSFGGVGLGIEKPEVLAGKVKKNKKAAARWLRTKVLIIDEGESLTIIYFSRQSLRPRSVDGRWRVIRQILQDRADDSEERGKTLGRDPDHRDGRFLPAAPGDKRRRCAQVLLRSGDVG